MQRPLTPEEARVLAVLVEKQHTVPDSYPLSLNALTLGCNQKTARDPVMSLSEADVLSAVNGLKELSLVTEVSGSRVVRFDHNAARGLGVPSQSVALLTLLILRGPQTAAELRLHCERLHRFADISSVEGFLEELAEREPHRVVKLPARRAPVNRAGPTCCVASQHCRKPRHRPTPRTPPPQPNWRPRWPNCARPWPACRPVRSPRWRNSSNCAPWYSASPPNWACRPVPTPD